MSRDIDDVIDTTLNVSRVNAGDAQLRLSYMVGEEKNLERFISLIGVTEADRSG